MMAEFWLISVPGNPEPDDSWGEIADRTSHLSHSTKFAIPELKVQAQDTSFTSYCPELVGYKVVLNRRL